MKSLMESAKFDFSVGENGLFVDSDGTEWSPRAIAQLVNSLHAEVSRLKETQRKLVVVAAFFAKTDILFHLTRQSGVTSLREAYYDPLVIAAIKEAENDS